MTEKKPTLRKLVLALLETCTIAIPGSVAEVSSDAILALEKAVSNSRKVVKQKKESKKYDTILAAPAETLNSILTYFTYQPSRKKYFADVEPAVVSETVLTVAHAIQAVLNNE